MHLSRLKLSNFKNHTDLELNFKQAIQVIIGQNGVGKTNILDAIHYLSVFRSHIQSQDSALIKQGESFYRVESDFIDEYHVVAKYSFRNKSIEINGLKIAKYSEYFGHIPLVLSCPNDIFLLHDGSEERRKFIDYSISIYNKEYLHKLNEYNQILDQRNALLKKEEKFDPTLIEFYDSKLVEFGHFIFLKRKEFINQFSPLVERWYSEIAQSLEGITILYSSQLDQGDFKELLKKNIEKDRILKRSTVGIHRDDIKLEMNNTDLKRTASQGQQKSLLYALRLAQAQMISQNIGKKVIFLLDDFSDRLDADRRRHLIQIILKIDFVSQWFISDTHRDIFEGIDNIDIIEL